jgi:thiamine-phosphate pyrophosphorylase
MNHFTPSPSFRYNPVMDTRILRILDASANRAREALRVLEDCARFARDDQALTASLKQLRHDLQMALARLPMELALRSRDTPNDVGTTVKTDSEFRRPALREVLAANAKRLSEALRSLEECAKTLEPTAAAQLEQLRYRGYTLEQSLTAAVLAAGGEERFRHVRLYVLLTEALCGPKPWEVILEDILEAAPAPADGCSPLCIQLREKELADGELLRRAKVVAQKCAEARALFILNDRADIAQLSSADGVHVGQHDLPCAAVRHILGPEAVVGVSTENLDQARRAVAEGATYVAVGPMFHTTTKHKPRIVGPVYAGQAVKEIPRPLVAIGGITPENVPQLTSVGIRAIAVSAAVLRVPDPAEAVRRLLAELGHAT